jgi:hypothetical protein
MDELKAAELSVIVTISIVGFFISRETPLNPEGSYPVPFKIEKIEFALNCKAPVPPGTPELIALLRIVTKPRPFELSCAT